MSIRSVILYLALLLLPAIGHPEETIPVILQPGKTQLQKGNFPLTSVTKAAFHRVADALLQALRSTSGKKLITGTTVSHDCAFTGSKRNKHL